jgi:hypothetical protein
MSNEININIVNKSRTVLAKFGEMFGKQLLTVKKVNIDPKYYEKKSGMPDNGIILPIRPITRYKIVRINITKLDLAVDSDKVPCIILNGGTVDAQGNSLEVTCPLREPQFNIEPSVENITRAIENQEKGGEVIYFKSPEKLTEAVNRLNKRELERVRQLIDDLNGQATSLDRTIKSDTEYVREYRKQLGETDTAQNGVEVNVHIENKDA